MQTLLLPTLAVLASVAVSLLPAQDRAGTEAQAAAGQSARLRFVPNRGQWSPEVQFGVLGATQAWLHRDGWSIRFVRWSGPEGRDHGLEWAGAVVRTRFRAGEAACVGSDPLPGVHNFLLGDDPSAWATGVPAFGSARLLGIRPGVDAVLRPLAGEATVFEYDLVLAPQADLASLVVQLEGVDGLRLGRDGALLADVTLPDGAVLTLRQRAPVAWQEGPAGAMPVTVRFQVLDSHSFTFAADGWDARTTLTIDPGVVWSTLLGGGSSESVNATRWLPGTGIYLGGWTGSVDFPVTPGAFQGVGQRDGYLALLREDGTSLVWSTYLGGSRSEEVRGIAVGAGGSVTAVGFTDSPNFPVTAGAVQGAYRGSSLFLAIGDAFVTRLDAAGAQLLGSTYLGGSLDEVAEGVALDAAGFAIVAGWSSSPDLATTPGVFQPALSGQVTLQPDGFVARVAPDARSLGYLTYLGGGLPDQLRAVAVDSQGRATVVGHSISANFPTSIGAFRTAPVGALEAVATRLDAQGRTLVWSTYLGGGGNDAALGVEVLADGSTLICGQTNSADFPTTNGAAQTVLAGGYDAFAVRLVPGGTSLSWSSLFGGPRDDIARAVARGPDAGVFLVGETAGALPVLTGAPQPVFGGGSLDGFAAWFHPSGGSIAFASYFGGTRDDVLGSLAMNPNGMVVLGGWSWSADWPTTAGALQTTLRGVEDGVVVQLDLLTDLAGALRIAAPAGRSDEVVQPETDFRALIVELTNDTVRTVRVDSVRVFVGGSGDNADLASLSAWLDPTGTGNGLDLVLLGGPAAPPAEGSDLELGLGGLLLRAGERATLVVTARTRPSCPTGAEFTCAVVGLDAWNASALGAGTGPRLPRTGLQEILGPVFACRAMVPFSGDDDGDGLWTVSDLRRLVMRLGRLPERADPDGDGIITLQDLVLLQQRILGRSVVSSVPATVTGGSYATINGYGLRSPITATLGGRSLLQAARSDRERSFLIDAGLAPGPHELRIQRGEVVLELKQVTVQ